jgi:hypothetical protein
VTSCAAGRPPAPIPSSHAAETTMMTTTMRLRQHLACSYPVYTSAVAMIGSNRSPPPPPPCGTTANCTPTNSCCSWFFCYSSSFLIISAVLLPPVRVMSASSPASHAARVRLTVGNRPVYRGNRPYRPGPVTVPAGYQPLGSKNFEFEFQRLKIVENIPKNTSWFIESGVKFVANLVHLV